MYRRNFKKVNYADSAFTQLTKIMLIKVPAGFIQIINTQVNLIYRDQNGWVFLIIKNNEGS